jgi:hypothetical protein
VGLPLVGKKLLKNKSKAVNFKKFLQIKDLNFIDQFLPVGSRGILYEARILAEENNYDLELIDNIVDLDKSAGPASVLLLSLREEDVTKLKKVIELPLNIVGRLL